ncbi:14329_t:CDS:1, partial [Dentiscutata erythropus]
QTTKCDFTSDNATPKMMAPASVKHEPNSYNNERLKYTSPNIKQQPSTDRTITRQHKANSLSNDNTNK